MKNILLFYVAILLGCTNSPSEIESKAEPEQSGLTEEKFFPPKDTANITQVVTTQVANTISESSKQSISSETSKIALDFFQWYADAIKSDVKDQYQPTFVSDEKGMMMVDYSKYIANLKRFRFSEELINREVENFGKCSANLKGIKFSEKDKYLSDLEDYENKGCDFFNYYRWIMDMETYDGARIIEEEKKGDSIIIKIQPFNFNENTKEYFFWDKLAKVTLKKNEGNWGISNIVI